MWEEPTHALGLGPGPLTHTLYLDLGHQGLLLICWPEISPFQWDQDLYWRGEQVPVLNSSTTPGPLPALHPPDGEGGRKMAGGLLGKVPLRSQDCGFSWTLWVFMFPSWCLACMEKNLLVRCHHYYRCQGPSKPTGIHHTCTHRYVPTIPSHTCEDPRVMSLKLKYYVLFQVVNTYTWFKVPGPQEIKYLSLVTQKKQNKWKWQSDATISSLGWLKPKKAQAKVCREANQVEQPLGAGIGN